MIEEVKRIFDDIRDAIIEMGGDVGNCTSPEEYAEAIKNLQGNNAVLYIPVFQSAIEKPTKPTKQMSSNNPTDYPSGGGTTDGLIDNIGMTYTIVGPDSVYSDGTEPIKVNFEGVEEETPITRTFIICLELPSLKITPDKPEGGTGDFENNRLVGPVTSVLRVEGKSETTTTDKGSTDNRHVNGNYTGLSMATFRSDGSIVKGENETGGSQPICINSAKDGRDGIDGTNGVDGDSQEFIYKRFHTQEDFDNEPQTLSDNNPDQKGYVPAGGTNRPEGITKSNIESENGPIEAVRVRQLNVTTHKGGSGSAPYIGAIGGEDGMDGDGVEYIFCVVSQSNVTPDPQTEGNYILDPQLWPPMSSSDLYTRTNNQTISEQALDEIYGQMGEFVPGNSMAGDEYFEVGDLNGTDDPLDVSRSQPFEFVSIRKYDGEAKRGRYFSEPKLGNKYYIADSPTFTSFAFTRTAKDIGLINPQGGILSNPIPDRMYIGSTTPTPAYDVTNPDGITGYDSIPDGTEPAGMTQCLFGGENLDPNYISEHQGGTSPKKIADTLDYQTEFCADLNEGPTNIELPDLNNPRYFNSTTGEVNETIWRNDVEAMANGTGGDEQDISDPIGMAQCRLVNGSGTPGVVSKIKGEDGLPGTNGNTIKTVLAYAVLPQEIDISNCTVINDNVSYSYENLGDTPEAHLQTYPSGGGASQFTYSDGNEQSGTYVTKTVAGSDTITDSEIEGHCVGMTRSIGTKNGDTGTVTVSSGSSPRRMSDTENYEVMGSPYDFADVAAAKAAIPINFSKHGVKIDGTGLASAESAHGFDEANDPNGPVDNNSQPLPAKWQAEIFGRNNTFTDDGTVYKIWAEDGETIFWQDVYTSAKMEVDLSSATISGGTFANPVPQATSYGGKTYTGTKGVPSTSDSIGTTKAKFSNTTPGAPIEGGLTPAKISDTETLEILYTASHPYSAIPSGFSKQGSDVAQDYVINSTWLTAANNAGGYDEPEDIPGNAPARYLAIATRGNGVGSEGQITEIPKGDTGAPGVNGVDGDGVEYVYIVTNSDTAPTIVSTAASRTDSRGHTYLDDDYLPLATGSDLTGNVECTDDPTGVDSTHKYEGVASRKKVFASHSTTTKVGPEYNLAPMSLGAKYGDDGVTYTLIPSVNSVIKDPETNTYNPATVSCNVIKMEGDTIVTADGILKYTFNGGSETNYSSAVSTAGLTTNITFLYYVNSVKVAQITVPLVSNGAKGASGVSGGNTAVVMLFKPSTTPIAAIDGSNNLTYTFATQSLNTVPSGGTLNAIPSTPRLPVYVTAATAYSTSSTDTIAPGEWSTPALYSKASTESASIFLYKRSSTVPTGPTGVLNYTFATATLSEATTGALNGGSTETYGTNSPCYVIHATAVTDLDHPDYDAINTSEGSSPQIFVQDGAPGAKGNTGPRMRMRNFRTTYTNPDSEGQAGWLSGNGANDEYYDVAIGPIANEGITITNAVSNTDRLYRCTNSITYAEIAALVAQYGADNVHPGSGGNLDNYFTQAVGGDFVATKLLLSDRIAANQIEAVGLSAQSITTAVTDGANLSIAGNTMELKKNGNTKCKISGNPITVDSSQFIQSVWTNPLGRHFLDTNLSGGGYSIRMNLGNFDITHEQGYQIDTLYSALKQKINLHFIGTGKDSGNTTGNIGVYITARISARNTVTDTYTIGRQAGYGANVGLFNTSYGHTGGTTYDSGEDGQDWNFEIDTTVAESLSVGNYDLLLDLDIVDIRLSEHFDNMTLYLSQYESGNHWYGQHSPIIRHHFGSSEIQYTDIGTDGFAHVLDGANKFFIQKTTNYLTLEFLSAGMYGLKIDSSGIKYTTDGGSTGSSNGAALNS